MKALTIILLVLAILVVSFLLVKNNISKNVTGKFDSFALKKIRGIIVPMADIDIKFTIENNSLFAFSLKEFKVKIYNTVTNEFLTENQVKKELLIPKGKSVHTVELLDNEIVGNINDFTSGNTEYLAVISFRYLGTEIEFQQEIKL